MQSLVSVYTLTDKRSSDFLAIIGFIAIVQADEHK